MDRVSSIVILALAVWAVTWLLTFWSGSEWFREKMGVGYDTDAGGFPIERWAGTRLAEWVSCPSCAAVIATAAVLVWHRLELPGIEALAVLGIVVLIVRWWQGARVKSEWWV